MTWSVAVYKGRVLVRELEIPAGGATIGRAPENDIVLEDSTKGVSRFHAEVRAESDGFVLVDLDSQNGVLVDGRKAGRETIRTGLTALIGQYRLVFATVPVPPPVDTGATVASSRALAPPEIVALPPAAPVPPSSGHPGTQRGPGVARIVAAIGSVAILAVVTTVAIRMSRVPVQAPPPVVTTTTTTSSVPAAPELPPVDQVETALAPVRELLDQKKYQEADDALKAIRESNPDDPRVATLADTIRVARTVTVPDGAVPALKARCVNVFLVGRMEKESDDARCRRSLQAAAVFKEAQTLLAAGDYVAAESRAQEMTAAFGSYPGADQIARDARAARAQRRRDEANEHFVKAEQLENAEKLRDALAEFDQAVAIDRDFGVAVARRDRLHQRIEAEAREAKEEAEFESTMNDKAKAIKRWRDVVALLPPGDPRAKEALARLQALGVK